MSELHYKTIAELATALEAGETTSVELTQAVIDRTAAVDDKVKAFMSFDADDALTQAKASDERRAAGTRRLGSTAFLSALRTCFHSSRISQ